MTRHYPFQKLCVVSRERNGQHLLLAAGGPCISSISVPSGKVLFQWPSHGDEESQDEDTDREQSETVEERPIKRRKLDSSEQDGQSRRASDASDQSIEIVAERKKGERRRPKVVDAKAPNVSHLLATRDGRHVVAVTNDDKSVRVFQVRSSGRLSMLSARSLPKRLCALKLTADEQTILAADKFGDVYSLPFHPSQHHVSRSTSAKPEITKFAPSATELTVHTKGNLEALRQQREQKKLKPRKEGPDFEHKLLLGHVSLLTDLVVADGLVDGRSRPFILTADRDEHIRISRGIPQAHVIEKYCLGHRDFISKLCIPSWASEILIAGNGEPSLRVFQWQAGEAIQEFVLEGNIRQEIQGLLATGGRHTEKLVVSGIWPIEYDVTSQQPFAQQFRGLIAVALEGLPLILVFALSHKNLLQHVYTARLQANVLDLTQLPQPNTFVISVDNVHNAASVKTFRSEDESDVAPLQVVELIFSSDSDDGSPLSVSSRELPMFSDTTNLYMPLPELSIDETEGNSKNKGYEKIYSTLGEFLYGMENLRKKRDETAEEEAAEGGETAMLEELDG